MNVHFNAIPEMTDPLGRHWHQPADIRSAPMDDTHVMLTQREVDELPEYSASMPSGVYPGKCWKWCQHPKFGDAMYLMWYGDFCDESRREVFNCKRRILVI